MFGLRKDPKDKERHRFYLLPGMGGRALRRKHKLILRWSVAAGLLVSAFLAVLLYLIDRLQQPH